MEAKIHNIEIPIFEMFKKKWKEMHCTTHLECEFLHLYRKNGLLKIYDAAFSTCACTVPGKNTMFRSWNTVSNRY